MKRRGPRTNGGEAREAILQAAREQFAAHGYEATSLRAIARAAGVDAALPSYHFGSKNALFVATLQLPVQPGDLIAGLLAGSMDDVGARLVRTVLAVWDDPRRGAPLIAVLRSVSTHDQAVREFAEREIVARLAAAIDAPDAQLRAGAVVTQVLGLVTARYVLRLEPIASASHDDLAALLAPTLQRYLQPPR
jgi:AcrR family transcriptional regulator